MPASPATTSSATAISSRSKGIGSIAKTGSHATSQPSSPAIRSASRRAFACMAASSPGSSARRSSVSSQRPLNAVGMPGSTRTGPVVARASARRGGVVAEGDGAAGGGHERVPPGVHRRGARVRVRAREGQPVALDAEAAEHHAERQVHPLEHRALLDVQLEVGGGAGEPLARPRRRGRGDAVGGERVGQRDAVAVGEAAHGVRVERAGARRSSRAGCGRSARPPRRPSRRAGRSRRAARRPARAAPRARRARRACRRASRRRAPSRGGCRRSRSARSRRAASPTVLPACVALDRDAGDRVELARAASRARRSTCPSTRRAGRRARRR